MSDVSELVSRIDGAFTAVKDKAKQQQQRELQLFEERRERLKEYEKVQPEIIAVAKLPLSLLKMSW